MCVPTFSLRASCRVRPRAIVEVRWVGEATNSQSTERAASHDRRWTGGSRAQLTAHATGYRIAKRARDSRHEATRGDSGVDEKVSQPGEWKMSVP